MNTLHRDEAAAQLGLNEIGRVTLRLDPAAVLRSLRRNRTTGGLILIDEGTNATVGAAMITEATDRAVTAGETGLPSRPGSLRYGGVWSGIAA